MVRQYLDTIQWDYTTGETVYDEDGNPTNPDSETISTSKARYENFRGSKREFLNRNGQMVLATGTLYVKYNELLPTKGTIISLIKIRGVNRIVANFEVLNVDPNQLNSTLHILEYVGNR